MDRFQNHTILVEKIINELSTSAMSSHKSALSCCGNSVEENYLPNPRNSISKPCNRSDASIATVLGHDLFIQPRQLVEMMSSVASVQNCLSIPIIDCRSQIDFGTEHLRTAHNINCRSKLIARKLVSKRLEEIEPSLSVLFNHFDDVILYDQSTNVTSEEQIRSLPIHLVVQAAQRSSKRVHIVQGGFNALNSQYPHLVDRAVEMVRDQDNLPPMPSSPQPIDKENFMMNEIIPHVFVGNAVDAQNAARLKQFGISHVINATPDLPFCQERKCKQLRVAILDLPSENILQYFESAIKFIDDALCSESHNVLVHCSAGISRSPTLVLAYMIRKRRLTLEEALRQMRCSRSIIDPNFSFIVQLRSWEKKCQTDGETTDDKRHANNSDSHRTRSKSSSRYWGSTSAGKSDSKSRSDAVIAVN